MAVSSINKIMESWVKISKIPDLDIFENYSVSNFGRIRRDASWFERSDGRRRFLEERIFVGSKSKGYLFAQLQRANIYKKFPFHRLVALAYIPNPNNLPQVNHKNGIRTDNRVENLEWVTNEENSRHAREVLKKDTGIQNRKRIVCLNNGIEYDSARDAARKLGVQYTNISAVLLGKAKTTGGYKFKFA